MIDAAFPERGAIDSVRIPAAAPLFEERAARLEALAPGSSAGEYLSLLARVARGQARAVREVPVAPAPAHGGSRPISPARVARDASWRRMLGVVLSHASGPGLPPAAREAIGRLGAGGPDALERLADAVLDGRVGGPEDLASAPFVGAALQAWFAALAQAVDPAAVERGGTGCPLCGSAPVAGVVQGDDRLRYVSCGMCGAQAHVPRIHCATCGANDAISYLGIEGVPGVRAEACGRCRTYLKHFDLEARPGAEPLADDLATIALDLLVAEEGFARGGANPLLWVAGAPISRDVSPGTGPA